MATNKTKFELARKKNVNRKSTGYNQHSLGVCYEGGLDATGDPASMHRSIVTCNLAKNI